MKSDVNYKGYLIIKCERCGHDYYRIFGEKHLYLRLKDAKYEIDTRTK